MPIDKRQPYETDIRVPFVIRGPGIKPGSVIDTPISSVDVFSTILNIAGLAEDSDGTSILTNNFKDRMLLIEYKGEKSPRASTDCPQTDDTMFVSYDVMKFFIGMKEINK